MRRSKNGDTVGITLRIPRHVLEAYKKIADRANLIALRQGGHATTTAQDVMRHRLQSLPVARMHANGTKLKDAE